MFLQFSVFIYDESPTPRAGFEPAQKLSSGFVERSCTVVIITTAHIIYVVKNTLKEISKVFKEKSELSA